jgi:hypothetical protein
VRQVLVGCHPERRKGVAGFHLQTARNCKESTVLRIRRVRF